MNTEIDPFDLLDMGNGTAPTVPAPETSPAAVAAVGEAPVFTGYAEASVAMLKAVAQAKACGCDTPEKWHTYDAWRESGYQVRRGEKSLCLRETSGMMFVFCACQVKAIGDESKDKATQPDENKVNEGILRAAAIARGCDCVPMTDWRSYDDWKFVGMQVQRGQRSTMIRRKKKPVRVFCKHQVEKA